MGNAALQPPELSDTEEEGVWTTVEDLSDREDEQEFVNSTLNRDCSITGTARCPDSGELHVPTPESSAEDEDETMPLPGPSTDDFAPSKTPCCPRDIGGKYPEILGSPVTNEEIAYTSINASAVRDFNSRENFQEVRHVEAAEEVDLNEISNQTSRLLLTETTLIGSATTVAFPSSASTPNQKALMHKRAPKSDSLSKQLPFRIIAAGILMYRYNPTLLKIEVLLGVTKKKNMHTILGGKANEGEAATQTACRELWEECGGQFEQRLIDLISDRLNSSAVKQGNDKECRLLLLPSSLYALYFLSVTAVAGLEEASSCVVNKFESFMLSDAGSRSSGEMREMSILEWVQIDAIMAASLKKERVSSPPSLSLSYFAKSIFRHRVTREYFADLA